jgi:hypothetical protein
MRQNARTQFYGMGAMAAGLAPAMASRRWATPSTVRMPAISNAGGAGNGGGTPPPPRPALPRRNDGKGPLLPIVHPNFTSTRTKEDVTQQMAMKVSNTLVANPALIPQYLSAGQNRFSSRGFWAQRIVFGLAVENAIATGAAPTGMLIHTGHIRPYVRGGADFVGAPGTPWAGALIQITSVPGYDTHVEKSAPETIWGLYPSLLKPF